MSLVVSKISILKFKDLLVGDNIYLYYTYSDMIKKYSYTELFEAIKSISLIATITNIENKNDKIEFTTTNGVFILPANKNFSIVKDSYCSNNNVFYTGWYISDNLADFINEIKSK